MEAHNAYAKILTRATKGRAISDSRGASHRNTGQLVAVKAYAVDVLKSKNPLRQRQFISKWKEQLAEVMCGNKQDNLDEIDNLLKTE